MNTMVTNPSWSPQGPEKSEGHFGKALLVGAVLEIALLAGLLWISSAPPPPKPVVKKIIAIHMVHPAPPKPKPIPVPPPPPKPVVQPKPVPVPRPKPIPQPRPVVHHTPAPKPLMAKTPLPTAPVVPPAPPVTPPAPPPPPPAPSMAARQAALARYASLVRAQVQADAHVPEAVRLMHLSGTAFITFRLTPSGQLLWARITQSSGVAAINQAALKSVKEGNYPPFTKNMPKHATNFTVEVHLSSHST
ncbi:TonB family protein [Acidithiobacillus thiooxidans]|nr:TonB family protein [Acidithiobacillus thiooxidans]MDX5935831.1 TonB family protein [Acidithiobacillus thiooxidans]